MRRISRHGPVDLRPQGPPGILRIELDSFLTCILYPRGYYSNLFGQRQFRLLAANLGNSVILTVGVVVCMSILSASANVLSVHVRSYRYLLECTGEDPWGALRCARAQLRSHVSMLECSTRHTGVGPQFRRRPSSQAKE